MAGAEADEPRIPRIVVSTGTDKRFPFDRLIDWVERWVAANPGRADVQVQWGISRAPDLPGQAQYTGDELDAVLAGADAVVLQGGPGGIMRSRAHGVRPVVVPREGGLGEAVDDHQIGFATWAAARGTIAVARTEASLHEALDRVLADPSTYRFEPEEPPTAETVARFAERVDRLWRTGR